MLKGKIISKSNDKQRPLISFAYIGDSEEKTKMSLSLPHNFFPQAQ